MADPRILVLGVGNTLMGDDGVGVHAVRALADGYEIPANVLVVDGGVAGLRLLGEIAAADYLIIVDAVRRGGVPGSIYRLRPGRSSPASRPVCLGARGRALPSFLRPRNFPDAYQKPTSSGSSRLKRRR